MKYHLLGMNQVCSDIAEWADRKEFLTPSNIDTPENCDLMLGKLMLCVTEDAEAAEAVRDADLQQFEKEIADSIIRHLAICGKMGIDIERHIHDKMLENEGRPIKHGRKCNL